MQDELDQLLSRRVIPPVPHGLAERIIAAATQVKVTQKWTLADLWHGFFDLFVLPQPAFALSLVLLVGFTLGFSAKTHPSLANSGGEIMTNFGVADEDYEEGDFL